MSQKQAMLFVKADGRQVALKSVGIHVDVREIAGMTTITQVFENTEEKAIEAVYLFPVEESAAVCGFEIETGGRTIKGTTEEREKAFELYDKAIDAGNAGFLLDQELKDVLNISVGNVLPGQTVKVTVRYVSELPVNDGVMRLQIPATVSPRYLPADTDPVKAGTFSPDYAMDAPYKLTLDVTVRSEGTGMIESPSHKVRVERPEGEVRVTLAEGSAALDRDFILEITFEKTKDPVCTLAEHANGEKALLFRFYPEFDSLPRAAETKSEVIFILDCSGSMGGSSIKEARDALDLSLRSLNEGDLFNIIRFGSTFELYSKEPVVYNEKNFEKAIRYINAIDANLGGTELLAPFQFVCGLPSLKGFTRDIILLTDGEVGNPDDVIRLVASVKDKMRVFTFGIGFGASHHLVKGLAKASNGASEMIMPGEKIQPKVLRQFARVSQACLTDVAVSVSKGRLELPGSLPQLFEGDSYTLLAGLGHGLDPDAVITFSARYSGEVHSWTTRVGECVKDDTVPLLWALSRIRELSEHDTAGSNQTARKEKAVEKEIAELGLSFSILTQYTSFVAIEEREEKDRTKGRPEYRKIPVQLTKDWHGMGNGGMTYAGAPMRTAGAMMPSQPVMYADSIRETSDLFNRISSGKGPGDHMKKSEKRGRIGGDMDFEPEKAVQDHEWYLELLKTQQADGSFSGIAVVASRLGKAETEIKAMAGKLKLSEKIVVTFLAVCLLVRDADTREVAKKAVKKAETWLKKKGGPFLADGRPLKEALEKGLGLLL